MARIDTLVFKTDSFDTDSLIKNVLGHSENSVILVLGFDRRIRVRHSPRNAGPGKDVIELFRFGGERLNRYLSPLLFLMDLAAYARLLAPICFRNRPRVCWIENTYAALIIGLLKKAGLCGRSIYLPGDWLMPAGRIKVKKLLWGLLFVAADYVSCRLNDMVLDSTERIREARLRFWGRDIPRKEELYAFNMEVKALDERLQEKRHICFIGNIRDDSGLDVAVRALPLIRKRHDIGLKIIGPLCGSRKRIEALAVRCGVGEHISFHGFIERERLPEAVADCFCGVNLLTDPESYSSYTIPGKIIHYLQFLIAVVTTEGAGVMAPVIEENSLGAVIKPDEKSFADAVLKIYEGQEAYRKNIREYIDNLPKTDLKRLLNV